MESVCDRACLARPVSAGASVAERRNGANLCAMPGATHAVVAMFDTDLDREAEQLIGLDRFTVPGVRSSAGFVSGHWALDRMTSVSVAFITFDSWR